MPIFSLALLLTACESQPQAGTSAPTAPATPDETPPPPPPPLDAPPTADQINGTYRADGNTECSMQLTVAGQPEAYTYALTIGQKTRRGQLTVELTAGAPTVYLTLEGIKWASYDGPLNDEGEAQQPGEVVPEGVGASWQNDTISLQNYGNSMNSYTVFADCPDKYITLVKQ
ncbi:hypothetical protein [Hymenobacter aerophilus]|uniref:hypothetical protein n=1 Tax=Hymenobacter aerophilus TaxID=119644 RepID=UPI0012FA76DB|nr:hypothetical protein [Hymenobacter aerophilus]